MWEHVHFKIDCIKTLISECDVALRPGLKSPLQVIPKVDGVGVQTKQVLPNQPVWTDLLKQVKQQQSEIFQFLDAKQIKYFPNDITQSPQMKEEMRKNVGNPAAMPPQVFNGDKYCGDYKAFFEAVEYGKPEKFFKL